MTTEKIYTATNIYFRRFGSKIVIVCILIYAAIFCLISYAQYISFSYTDIDLSVIERNFWNAIHGKFASQEIAEPTVFGGGHLFLIIFLLVPFYIIYPHSLTLLFMQTAALAVPAYFIYVLAREKVDASFAFYFALAYLLYPALAYVNLFEFHIIAFAPLFLVPMFIFFEQRKFWPFVLFMFLSLACKQDISLVIFGLGVYALFKYARFKPPFIQKSDWKWIVIPLLSGVFWFILVTQFIQPHFIPAELKDPSVPRGALVFYKWLGNTPIEIIRNIFLHPVQVLKAIFIPAKNSYLLQLFSPLAFLSVFGLKEMVIVLFGLLESLLSQRGTHFSIHYQYPALVMPFIFISAIFGLRRLLRFNFFKRLKPYILITLFSTSLFLAFKIGPLFKLPFKQWKRQERDLLKEEFIKLVPHQAAVGATFELATRLTHRGKLFFIYHVNMTDWPGQYAYLSEKCGKKANHLLIDFLDQWTYFGFYYQNSDIYLKNFLEKYNWQVIYELDNIALWVKNDDKGSQLISSIDEFPEDLPGPSFANEDIRLVGSNFKREELLAHPVLHMDSYLQCQRPTDKRYILRLDFYSLGERRLLYSHYFIAADRIYPTKRWKKGEKIRISQNVLIPESLKIENCSLVLSLALME